MFLNWKSPLGRNHISEIWVKLCFTEVPSNLSRFILEYAKFNTLEYDQKSTRGSVLAHVKFQIPIKIIVLKLHFTCGMFPHKGKCAIVVSPVNNKISKQITQFTRSRFLCAHYSCEWISVGMSVLRCISCNFIINRCCNLWTSLTYLLKMWAGNREMDREREAGGRERAEGLSQPLMKT